MFNIKSAVMDFVILKGCSLKGRVDKRVSFVTTCRGAKSLCAVVVKMVHSLPYTPFMLTLILVAVVTFCTASFSSVTLATSYCDCRELKRSRGPGELVRLV